MAVAFESVGGNSWASSTSNAAITTSLPGTRPVGSVLLFVIHHMAIGGSVTTAPSGYTLLTGYPVSSATSQGGRIWVYAKIVAGGETAPSFACDGTTGTSGQEWGGCIFCYSGVDTSGGIQGIVDATGTPTDAAGTTVCTYPAVTTVTDGAMLFRALRRLRDSTDTFTPTAGHNERQDDGTTARLGGQFHAQDKLAGAAGVQAAADVTPSNTSSARYLAISIALKPVVSGTALTLSVDDTLSLADSEAQASVKVADETLTLSDALSTQDAFHLGVSDSLSLDDARANSGTHAFEENLTLTDDFANLSGLQRDEALGLVDDFVKRAGLQRDEALGSVDAFIKRPGLRQDEALGLVDDFVKRAALQRDEALALTDGRVAAVSQVLTDTVALTDVISRAAALSRQETLAFADSVARSVGVTLADALALSDSSTADLGEAGTQYTLLLQDGLTLADNQGPATQYERTVDETLTLVDARLAGAAKRITDALALNDARALRAAFHYAVTEVFTLADELDLERERILRHLRRELYRGARAVRRELHETHPPRSELR